MTPHEYLQELAARLQADRCELKHESTSAPTPLLIAQRADLRAATRLHLFTIATIVPEITVPVLKHFTEFAMDTAIARKKGLMRGLNTGVAVFPTLISERVDPAAVKSAAAGQKARFACMARPTVIDTSNRIVGTYRDTPFFGIVYALYLRRKSQQYFPQPQ